MRLRLGKCWAIGWVPKAHSEMTAPVSAPRPMEVALLASVFVVAACGLVYELAAAALASYVLGDSVLQFSTIIGAYLFAIVIGTMGMTQELRHQTLTSTLLAEPQ